LAATNDTGFALYFPLITPGRPCLSPDVVPTLPAYCGSARKGVFLQTSEVSKQRARTAKTPQQRRKNMRWGLIALLILASISTGIGLHVYHALNNPYRDGYNYASQFNMDSSQLRGCYRGVMISEAHDPNDDYSQWAAGCRAGTKLLNNAGTTGNNGALGRRPRLIY
jgi:hypothetical protein